MVPLYDAAPRAITIGFQPMKENNDRKFGTQGCDNNFSVE